MTTSTKLYGPWLHISRVLWVVLSLTALVILIASMTLTIQEPLPSCIVGEVFCAPWQMTREDAAMASQLGLPDFLAPLAYHGSNLFLSVGAFLFGLLIFVRRSDDWMAQLISLMLTLRVVENVQNLGTWMLFVSAIYTIPVVIFTLLPFIFPNGRFVPANIRWLVGPLVAFIIVVIWLPLLDVIWLPLLGGAAGGGLYESVLVGSFLAWFLVGGYAALYRYRHVASSAERQQIKWAVGGVLAYFIVIVPIIIAAVWFPPTSASPERLAFVLLVQQPIYLISTLCLPVGIAFAILRYRLWDIDVVIRKTLIYSALSGILALVYFGSVLILQQLFGSVVGVERTPVAIVISTLAIAALFTPLRNRVQVIIDRRFYRQKYDAQQVLAQFAQTARDETDLDALTAELTHVVQETLQPEQVSVWLRRSE
jgi:hypothetical protein